MKRRLKGIIRLSGDKSISHRAALFAALRPYPSLFENFNFNRDCSATLNVLSALGISWQKREKQLLIKGRSIKDWQDPEEILDAQNSGTTARLLSGLLIHLPYEITLTGDASLQKRPMRRIIAPLEQMGATINSTENRLPVTFVPGHRINGIRYPLPVASAQVKSAVLLAGLYAGGQTEVIETVLSRDHTERMLGLRKKQLSDGSYAIYSSREDTVPELSMYIPGDISGAAFFIAGALLSKDSQIVVPGVSLNPSRTGFLSVLKEMGASFDIRETQDKPEPMGDLSVHFQELHNIEIPKRVIPNLIDEIPILAIVASQAHGIFRISGAEELRYKESDRIAAICTNLRAVGVEVNEEKDGFQIKGPQKLKGGRVITHGDHRIAMSFAIANLLSERDIELDDADCVSVSFPSFWDILDRVTE